MGGARVAGSLLRFLTFGAGGGAGGVDSSPSNAIQGGAGGGVVFARAGSVTGNGAFSADGEAPGEVQNDGGAGGGAGGSIVVRVANGATCVAHARGANGAKAASSSAKEFGPGGGGGGGRALVQAQSGACPPDVNSGVAGAFFLDGGAAPTNASPSAREPGFVETLPGGYVP
jgi:hypothetical protein